MSQSRFNLEARRAQLIGCVHIARATSGDSPVSCSVLAEMMGGITTVRVKQIVASIRDEHPDVPLLSGVKGYWLSRDETEVNTWKRQRDAEAALRFARTEANVEKFVASRATQPSAASGDNDRTELKVAS